jgi:hypothetical protein
VFLAVLELCRAAGLIRLGLVALDGTKVKANAALDANRTASSIEAEIARMLAEAEAVDAREDRQFQRPAWRRVAGGADQGCGSAGAPDGVQGEAGEACG